MHVQAKTVNIKIALTRIKIVQSFDNNIEIIDNEFLVSGHLFLLNDRDFGSIEVRKYEKRITYTSLNIIMN